MRVLVTGATGFVGSHMVELLHRMGWEVVCPVRNPLALRNLEGLSCRTPTFSELDSMMVEGYEFDYAFHMAGATRGLAYEDYRKANVELTRRLLDLLLQSGAAKRLKRFVLVSSQAAAGPSPDDGSAISEDAEPRPVSHYGMSKLEAERVVLTYSDRLPITIARPCAVFGPRDVDVLGAFKSAQMRFIPYLAGPPRLVSLIYVKDLVEGILAACLSPRAVGGAYFLANADPVRWIDFVSLIASCVGKSALKFPIPLPLMAVVAKAGDILGAITGKPQLLRSEKFAEMKQMAWVCSTERAKIELQWEATTALETSVKETADWYKQQGWI